MRIMKRSEMRPKKRKKQKPSDMKKIRAISLRYATQAIPEKRAPKPVEALPDKPRGRMPLEERRRRRAERKATQ